LPRNRDTLSDADYLMPDLIPLVEWLRELEGDADLETAYLQAAGDLVGMTWYGDGYVVPPEFEALSEEDRGAYLASLATSLAPLLRRAVLTWTIFEAESPADWISRNDRSG
jgi:hypothetical protein